MAHNPKRSSANVKKKAAKKACKSWDKKTGVQKATQLAAKKLRRQSRNGRVPGQAGISSK